MLLSPQNWLQLHVEALCTNGNTGGEGENSKFGGFQDLHLITWSRIWSSRQDSNIWEMPLQWLLIHAVQHKCKMQSKSVTTVSVCSCIALGYTCCLYPQKYNQNQVWTPADHHADAAAPEDFHLVGTQQQRPADTLSTKRLPSNNWSLLFHSSCQYAHKATRTLSKAQPICRAFWSCVTHCCP